MISVDRIPCTGLFQVELKATDRQRSYTLCRIPWPSIPPETSPYMEFCPRRSFKACHSAKKGSRNPDLPFHWSTPPYPRDAAGLAIAESRDNGRTWTKLSTWNSVHGDHSKHATLLRRGHETQSLESPGAHQLPWTEFHVRACFRWN
jgi:hypothetical protein